MMPDDQEFEKSKFESIIRGLLKSKPLPKKRLKTSKKTKVGAIIPHRQPKHEK